MTTGRGVALTCGLATLVVATSCGPASPGEVNAAQREPTAEAAGDPLADTLVAARPAPLPPPPATSALEVEPAVAAVVAAIGRGETEAIGSAMPMLARQTGQGRDRLFQALLDLVDSSPPSGLAAALGPTNAFLHLGEGRALALRVVERARKEPAASAAVILTGVLAACMRGEIEKQHADARAVVDQAYAALGPPLRQTVFNPSYLERARSHQVKGGESLDRIARRFRGQGYLVDAGTLAVFNGIRDASRLREGQVIKIPIDPIRTVVEKPSFLKAVYLGEVIFRLYWIGHGKDGCTPEATFTVEAKQERPDWYTDGRVIPYGHPDNLLGDYFVKFKHPTLQGYGAHGTSEPESIGTMASAGCLRMGDDDIADYFRLIPVGSEVEVRSSAATVRR